MLLQEVGRPWLLGFAIGRSKSGGDVSGRDLFLRRSSDGGRSWDAPRQWARVSNQSLAAGDGVYTGSAVFDSRTNTSMVLWVRATMKRCHVFANLRGSEAVVVQGDCLERCSGEVAGWVPGDPRRSNETILAAPSFMMTRSTDVR